MKEKNKNVSSCMHMLSKLKMGKNIRASFKYKSKKSFTNSNHCGSGTAHHGSEVYFVEAF